ncbi:hypothetical protein NIM86_10355 [Notoacmeibacter sp. MSK16QG-6]|nr:hypothetical protein [Notoacmeibacter sp. MSK16QG-6]
MPGFITSMKFANRLTRADPFVESRTQLLNGVIQLRIDYSGSSDDG